MHFRPASLPGVWIVTLEPREDERGFLARTYCDEAFAAQGLNTRWPQCNLTLTRWRGMIRGLHFQAEPRPETKLILCVGGAVLDVLLDVRRDSPTFGRWESFELTAPCPRLLYVPGGIAHGFQCLTDNCQLFYHMSDRYVAELARGVRWNDPALGIPWPLPERDLSERDRTLPLLAELS